MLNIDYFSKKYKFKLPTKPRVEDYEYIYVYKKGELFYSGLTKEISKKISKEKTKIPEDVLDLEISTIIAWLTSNGFIIEKTEDIKTRNMLYLKYQKKLNKTFTELKNEVCSESGFGIKQNHTTEVLFELARRTEEHYKYGSDFVDYIEKLLNQYQYLLHVMSEFLSPLPGCFIYRKDGTSHFFRHTTNYNAFPNTRLYLAEIQSFLEGSKHSHEDKVQVAKNYYNDAPDDIKELLPKRLLSLAGVLEDE